MTNISESFLKNIGKRLRELRKNKKLTQVQLSTMLLEQYHITIDERSISRYETGKGLPETDNLIYLADFFETSTDYILYGKKTVDEDSLTWYDNFKRLNRLMYTMQIGLLRSKDNASDVYLQLFDVEAKEWFGRMWRFIDSRNNMLRRGVEKDADIEDLDALFEDFKEDRTQLCPIEEKRRRAFLTAQAIATAVAKEDNDEIVITTRIPKQ